MTAIEPTITAMTTHPAMKVLHSPQSLEPKSAATSFNLLLVENSRVARIAVIRVLESIKPHCQIHQANTAANALQLSSKYHYDAILMDIDLPDGDGRLLTQKIREAKPSKNRHTPIVALTAHANDKIRQECLAIGMNAVWQKPLSAEQASDFFRYYCLQHQAKECNTRKSIATE